MYVQPAVAGELVFLGSCSGTYYAFERETGEVRWSYDTKVDGRQATFHTNPVVAGDLLVTGSDGGAPGYIYAFERETGKVRWKKLLEQGQVSADLALARGSILALGSNGDLVALAPETGEIRWVFDSPSDPYRRRGRLSVHGDRVYSAGMDEAVYAVDVTDGRELWRSELGASATTSILLDDGALVVGTADGKLLRLDPENGSVLGALEVGTPPGGNLVLSDKRVVFLRGEPSRTLSATGMDLANIEWVREPEQGSWSTDRPIPWRGYLLAGDSRGNLIAFDAKDGSAQWTAELQGQLRGIGHAGDTLYVGTVGGVLYALTPELEKTKQKESKTQP